MDFNYFSVMNFIILSEISYPDVFYSVYETEIFKILALYRIQSLMQKKYIEIVLEKYNSYSIFFI